MENFIVPDKHTCMSYDSAFKKATAKFNTRTRVYEHVASHLIAKGVASMKHTGSDHSCTTKKLGDALTSLETKGLKLGEETACDAFTSGAGAVFCHEVVSSPFASWVNGKITHLSIVQQFNKKVIGACEKKLPDGWMSKIDQVLRALCAGCMRLCVSIPSVRG